MPKKAPTPYVFWFFMLCWTLIHVQFEYRFWLGDSTDIFRKYAASTPEEQLEVAKRVYYTKATWMFAIVWLQALGMRLRSAMAWSFLMYSGELLAFFPITKYAIANVGLSAGLVFEDIRWRLAGAP